MLQLNLTSTRLWILKTGKTSSKLKQCHHPPLLVSTGGEMLVQNNAKGCFRCLMSQGYLLLHVDTGSSFLLAIWLRAANCKLFYLPFNLYLLIIVSAKYSLAVVDQLLTVYGKNGGCAYDIGCAFAKTLGNSTLGPRASALNFRMMVGAFHGHAHNRRCQIDWHPMYIEGTGHTEGEGCEHIFSSSSELARSTRHATTFHRHQSIEQHFTFWDEDKYTALSTFL